MKFAVHVKEANQKENNIVKTKTMTSCSFLFLDFDGVIKESITIKSDAFEELFTQFGEQMVSKVREHHTKNGGLSRYEKIPLYLEWAGEDNGDVTVSKFCDSFSTLVTQAVIDSPWVGGVKAFLESAQNEKMLFLLTATPQQEIEEILNALQIMHCFKEVHGAPMTKGAAMANILSKYNADATNAVMVGDSKSDYAAAKENGVGFILRRTFHNVDLQDTLNCQMIDDFTQ
jgi:phosphoglycolate phosphatase-like HAD superfamily hydrolase